MLRVLSEKTVNIQFTLLPFNMSDTQQKQFF